MNRVFEAHSNVGRYLADDALPETLALFFDHMHNNYHRFLRVSREALAAG